MNSTATDPESNEWSMKNFVTFIFPYFSEHITFWSVVTSLLFFWLPVLLMVTVVFACLKDVVNRRLDRRYARRIRMRQRRIVLAHSAAQTVDQGPKEEGCSTVVNEVAGASPPIPTDTKHNNTPASTPERAFAGLTATYV